MSQSLKAVLILIFLIALILGIISWLEDSATQKTWMLRWCASGSAVLALVLLLRAEYRKDGAPDFLKETFGSYYERDGFCFLLGVVNVEGRSLLRVFFQNRYAGRCEAVVQVKPERLRVRKPPMPALTIAVPCPGGSYGKSETLWPIPADWQGKTCLLTIAAASRYPHGKGEMLRFRTGMDVAKAQNGIWDTATALLTLATAGPIHALLAARGTRLKVQLPEGVSGDLAVSLQVITEVLWNPENEDDDSTDGTSQDGSFGSPAKTKVARSF